MDDEVWVRLRPPRAPEPLPDFLVSVIALGLRLLSLAPRAEREELVRVSFVTPPAAGTAFDARPALPTIFLPSTTASVPFAALVTSPRAFLRPFRVDVVLVFLT